MSKYYAKRTRKQALLRLKKLWETMRDNKCNKAYAYRILGWPNNSDSADCPACTYNSTHIKDYCCSNCILPWAGGDGCMESIDEYTKWCRNKTPENANAIVKLCDRALKEL